jgi:hypothetical protein
MDQTPLAEPLLVPGKSSAITSFDSFHCRQRN